MDYVSFNYNNCAVSVRMYDLCSYYMNKHFSKVKLKHSSDLLQPHYISLFIFSYGHAPRFCFLRL